MKQYETAVGKALDFSDAAEAPAVAALPVHEEPSQPAQPSQPSQPFRIHGADVQLTFNKSSWRSQTQTTADWFASQGVRLVASFQTWALETLKQKFQEPILHVSLTLEESCHAAGGARRVHLHAQITFARRIDRTSVTDFMFDGVKPHVAA